MAKATPPSLALKEVNMHVEPGEVVGFDWPIRLRQEHLLKCLGAVIDPSAGRMRLGSDLIFDNGWKVPDLRLAPRQDRFCIPGALPDTLSGCDRQRGLLPMLAGMPNGQARQRALELLTALDVHHRAKAMPSQLSGGEQQRVAIARGWSIGPGDPGRRADRSLIPCRAMSVVRILNDMAQRFETAVIVVTHDEKSSHLQARLSHP